MEDEALKMPKEFVSLVEQILFLADSSYQSGYTSGFSNSDGKLPRNSLLIDTCIDRCLSPYAPFKCKELLGLLLDYKRNDRRDMNTHL